MSALHGPARMRPDRMRRARTAPPRRYLNLVARPGARTSRAPFVSVIVVMVVVGLVGLLVLNTTMQKRAFELARLQDKADALATREAALNADVQRLSSPAHVAGRAGELGMVPNTNPVFLRLSDGKVIGEPEPAMPGTNLPGIEPEADHKTGKHQRSSHQGPDHRQAENKPNEPNEPNKPAEDKPSEQAENKPTRKQQAKRQADKQADQRGHAGSGSEEAR